VGIEIIGAESLGVRGLCCLVTRPDRRIVIDPGVSLGYLRHGLLPHPLQIARGRRVREKILWALESATDVVFSHFHGDHVPLVDANPYQLSIQALPACFREIRCWSRSNSDLSKSMSRRFKDLEDLLGTNMQIAEGRTEGTLSFSGAVPHGAAGNPIGSVMMSRIAMGDTVFVHASDIQLLDSPTVNKVIDWQPDVALAAGPPLYLDRLTRGERERAWANAVRLARNIDTVILDHHLMRSEEGAVWLDRLSATVGRKVYCAADFMGQPRQLLEAKRVQLYEHMPVPDAWHDDYVVGKTDPDDFLAEMRWPAWGPQVSSFE
jgi:predicted metallo-beta-lactamase superfamily hydrolase